MNTCLRLLTLGTVGVVALASLAGCSGASDHSHGQAAVAPAGASTHVVSPADSGKVLNPAVGDRIVFTAEENPSTGYLWRAETDAAVLAEVDSTYEQTNPDPNIVGAPGVRTITYAVVGKGRTTLVMTHARSFEPSSPLAVVSYEIAVGGTQAP